METFKDDEIEELKMDESLDFHIKESKEAMKCKPKQDWNFNQLNSLTTKDKLTRESTSLLTEKVELVIKKYNLQNLKSLLFQKNKEEKLNLNSQQKLSSTSFIDFGFSKKILKACTDLGYNFPTIIQSLTIPKIMKGNELMVQSATGTGKTAAFLLPLLHKISLKKMNKTIAIIVTPTRELALQIKSMLLSLSKYIPKFLCSVVVGGFNLQEQEAELRLNPDIIIGTPGRLRDIIENTYGVSFDTVEIVILDEADKILEQFPDQIKILLKEIPKIGRASCRERV